MAVNQRVLFACCNYNCYRTLAAALGFRKEETAYIYDDRQILGLRKSRVIMCDNFSARDDSPYIRELLRAREMQVEIRKLP